LEVSSIKKSFGSTIAVKNVSFRVNQGEIVALLGPNGAGKTTTLRLIAGLLQPEEGEIKIAGYPHTHSKAKKCIAYVPETVLTYPMLTVKEHLRFVSLAYKTNGDFEERAAKLLKRFQLEEKKNHLAKSLSKGMKQKLLIACALIHKAKLLIFDEPLIGLDPKACRELKEIMMSGKEAGGGILISTHILEVAEDFADRVIILSKGELVATGNLEKLRCLAGKKDSARLEEVFLTLTEPESERK
jgi:ABC-type multidrug transport system ATPase subunit